MMNSPVINNKLKVYIHDIILSENGFIALLRPEDDDNNQVLVINIGFLEAQLLTVQFNKVPTSRPLIIDTVHHLFNLFNLSVNKIIINEMKEEVFLAQIFLENKETNMKYVIDAKSSDALIFALNFNAEVYVDEETMRMKSVSFNFYKEDENYEIQQDIQIRMKGLKQALKQAIQDENYEEAVKIRDELRKLTGENSD